MDPISKRLDYDDNDASISTTTTIVVNNVTLNDTIEAVTSKIDDTSPVRDQQPTTPPIVVRSAMKGRSARKQQDPLVTRSVRFDRVNVFLFERAQGHNCIPSDNINKSITIGMSPRHVDKVDYELDNYNKDKRLFHLNKLEEEKTKIYESVRASLQVSAFIESEASRSPAAKKSKKTPKTTTTATTLYEPSDEQVEAKIREALETTSNDPNGLLSDDDRIILDILMNREYYEDPRNELPLNMELFLPILSPEERRKLLIESGVDEIDDSESKEIVDVRKSRQFCGCKCKSAQSCQQSTCSCFANGIPCQIDKIRFPCACNLKRCKNPAGLKRFNQVAVLKHYEKTLTPGDDSTTTLIRLHDETEQDDQDDDDGDDEINSDQNQENNKSNETSKDSSNPNNRKLLTTVNSDMNDELASSNETPENFSVGAYPDSPRLKRSVTTSIIASNNDNNNENSLNKSKKSKRKSHEPKKIQPNSTNLEKNPINFRLGDEN